MKYMVEICRVSNGKDMVLAPEQLQASYTNVRHWEELIDLIDENGGPKEQYILTLIGKCTLEQDEFGERLYGIVYTQANDNRAHIWPDCVRLLPYECFQVSTWTEPENISGQNEESYREGDCWARIRSAKVIPASCVTARCAQLLIIIHRLWTVLKWVEERRERMMVGKRMMLVLMEVLIERIELIVFHP